MRRIFRAVTLEVAREGGCEEGRGRAETVWCRGVGCGGEGGRGEEEGGGGREREGEEMRHSTTTCI